MSAIVEAARRATYASTDLMTWCLKNVRLGNFSEFDELYAANENLKRLLPPVENWIEGPPPRRGAYRVKSGKSAGYRYWDGEIWGNLHNIRSCCLANKCSGLRSRIAHQVLWLKKGAES
jgi:hypothetical protein